MATKLVQTSKYLTGKDKNHVQSLESAKMQKCLSLLVIQVLGRWNKQIPKRQWLYSMHKSVSYKIQWETLGKLRPTVPEELNLKLNCGSHMLAQTCAHRNTNACMKIHINIYTYIMQSVCCMYSFIC